MNITQLQQFEKSGKLDEALKSINLIESRDTKINLLEIKILLNKGNFILAKTKINQLENFSENLSLIENIELQLYKIKTHLSSGEIDEAEKVMEYINIQISDNNYILDNNLKLKGIFLLNNGWLNEKKTNWNISLDNYNAARKVYLKLDDKQEYTIIQQKIANILQKQNKLKKAYKILEAVLIDQRKFGNKHIIIETLTILGIIRAKQRLFDDAFLYLNESREISIAINCKQKLAKANNNIGNVLRIKNESTKSIQYYSVAIANARDLGDFDTINAATINLGSIHLDRGDLDNAINTYAVVLSNLENIRDNHLLGIVINNMGLAYEKRGDLTNALEYYNKALEIRQKVSNKQNLAKTMQSIGHVHILKGNLNIAFDYLIKASHILEKGGDKIKIADVYHNLATVHSQIQNIEEAEKYYLKSLKLREEIKNEINLSYSLFNIIMFYHKNNKNSQKYLKQFRKLAKKSNNNIVKMRFNVIEGILLQSSHKLSDRVKGNEIFEEVLKTEFVDFELTVYSLLNICEYLLLELKTTSSKETLFEIHSLMDKLFEIATDQEAYTLIVETLIIKSKLSLLNNDLSDANDTIKMAKNLAENKKLDVLYNKANLVADEIEIIYNNWEKQSIKHLSMEEKINVMQLNNMVDNIHLKKESTDMFVHDLKNMLQINLSVANLLALDDSLSQEVKQYVKMLEATGREIQLQISNFMTSSKLDSNEFNINNEKLNIAKIIEDRLDMYSIRLQGKGILAEYNARSTDLFITTDRFLLALILDNLIQNAIKFSPINSVVSIHLDEKGFSICNGGEIILPRKQNLIFEKYYQLDRSKTKNTGFGLGLTLCKKATETLDWSISVESPRKKYGDGVCFSISFMESI